MIDIKILNQWIKICNIHARRLKINLNEVENLIPLTAEKVQKLDDNTYNHLDLVIFKFSKLQDDIGNKIFPIFLMIVGEDIKRKSFIDILNRLEQMYIIESAQFWKDLKETRNSISHDYPDDPELVAKNLNDVLKKSKILLKFWTKLKKEIAKHVK